MSAQPEQGPIDLDDLGFDAEHHHDEHHDHREDDVQDSLVDESLQHLMDGTHDEDQHHHSVHTGLQTPNPLLVDQQRQQHEQGHYRDPNQHLYHGQDQHYRHASHHVQPTRAGEILNQRNDPSQPPTSKKQRRRYDNNFKAKVLQHLKIPGIKLPAVAKQFNVPENTVREWTKISVVQAIETARVKNSGQLKANVFDPIHRLTKALMEFFEENEKQPQHIRQPVTTKLVVAKGLETKKNLLELDQIQPYLDPMERKALNKFTASDSWAKKFAKRHHLKMTGARIKDLSEEEMKQFHYSLTQIALRVKQAGPRYEEVNGLLLQAGEKLWLASSGMACHDINPQQRRNDPSGTVKITNEKNTAASNQRHAARNEQMIASKSSNMSQVTNHQNHQQQILRNQQSHEQQMIHHYQPTQQQL